MIQSASIVKKLVSIAAIVCGATVVPTAANAALVTLQGTYTWSGSSYGSNGLLEFTYDDSTPDADPSPTAGLYYNAMTFGRFTLGSSVFELDDSVTSTIEIHGNSDGPADARINATFQNVSDQSPYSLRLNFEADATEGESLSVLIGLMRNDSCASFLNRVGGGGSYYVCQTGPLTAVPIPPAVWLFGSALGLVSVMRQKK